jgi:NTP pyrophosphatase (non-canonical NTP hydrolase)
MTEINFNDFAKQVYKGNAEKGFWDDSSHDKKDAKDVALKLMLITSELGEAMEAHRKGRFFIPELFKTNWAKMMPFQELFEKTTKDTFEDEIADAMIRLFDMAGGLNIDLNYHIMNKLKYNGTREKLHGKNY